MLISWSLLEFSPEGGQVWVRGDGKSYKSETFRPIFGAGGRSNWGVCTLPSLARAPSHGKPMGWIPTTA
jgi:hypothetical protein